MTISIWGDWINLDIPYKTPHGRGYRCRRLPIIMSHLDCNHYGAVRMLLEKGANVNVKIDDNEELAGQTALMLTFQDNYFYNWNVNFTRIFIEQPKIDANIQDAQGKTALHHFILKYGRLEPKVDKEKESNLSKTIDLLLKHKKAGKLNCSIQDHSGLTALNYLDNQSPMTEFKEFHNKLRTLLT